MPATTFREYADGISTVIIFASAQAQLLNLQIDQRSMQRGFIAGTLAFNDDSELHFREFVDLTQIEPRLMYAYHYQDANKNLIFRYDNAPHKPALIHPEHKHTPQKIIFCPPPILAEVIDEILDTISSTTSSTL